MENQTSKIELLCCNALCTNPIINEEEIVYFPENHTIYHKNKICINRGYTFEFLSGRQPKRFEIISLEKAIELKQQGKINEPEKK